MNKEDFLKLSAIDKAEELKKEHGIYAHSYAMGCLDANKDMFINGIRDKRNKERRTFWKEVITILQS